jgi:VanZ family protein
MSSTMRPVPGSRAGGPFLIYWLPVVIYCAIIFVQSSLPSPDLPGHFPHADKLWHTAGYAILGLLFCRALGHTTAMGRHRRWIYWAAVLAAFLYGVSDEAHQCLVAARQGDWRDAMADLAGSLIGAWFYLAVQGWRPFGGKRPKDGRTTNGNTG